MDVSNIKFVSLVTKLRSPLFRELHDVKDTKPPCSGGGGEGEQYPVGAEWVSLRIKRFKFFFLLKMFKS